MQRAKRFLSAARPYLAAVLVVLVASLAGLPFRGMTDPDNLTMIYLTGVVYVALRMGLWPAVLASVLSVAAFNFLFTPPYYTFSAFNPSAYLTFLIMLASSLLVAAFASGIAGRLSNADRERAESQLLFDLSRDLATAASKRDIGIALHHRLGLFLEATVELEEPCTTKPGAGVSAEGAIWRVELATGGRCFGTMAIRRESEVPPSRRQVLELETISALVAGTMLRIEDAGQAARQEADAKSERLRNVLLSSLSHDLRTPLTVLSGTVANLVRMRRRLPREAMDEITDLSRQVNRLQKFTGNLLKIAAISSGQLRLNRQAYGIQEIIGVAIERIRDIIGQRQMRTQTLGDLPMVDIDGALIEQVVTNLLDNAISHTEDDGTITLRLEKSAGMVKVSVIDDGPGLSSGDEDIIFERFRTGAGGPADRRGAGSHGLGLAICRGIVEAHGGLIDARNNSGSAGACFSFTLPVCGPAEDIGIDPGH